MSTSAPSVAEEVYAAPEESSNNSRLKMGDKLVATAKGAVKLAIVALGIAAQATQSVPYLGAVSTALTELMKIQDEVDVCKDECRAVMDDARQIRSLIKTFRDKCVESGRGESVLSITLREAFTELERIVLGCIVALQRCKVDSKRKRDRVRLYLKRSELTRDVKDCAAKVGKALQQFNTTLQVDQVVLLEDIRSVVHDIREAQSSSVSQRMLPSSEAWSLRAASNIFYGREVEVEHVVRLIMSQDPARVAVLGPGGIGKTSIALAILHHPEVETLYGERRSFLSCEAITTAGGIIRALAEALGLPAETGTSAKSTQHRLVSYLRTATGIICLDNLETPWNADTAAVEEFIVELASLPSMALLITSRVTDTPLIGWSSPPLQPIAPFSREAAIQTWDAICHDHDEYTNMLVEAVDCVPLAVTLLARLARSETPKDLWSRWETEHTELVRSHGAEHRLNNLDISIGLSLQALHYPAAGDVLSIICIFPLGLGMEGEVPSLEHALKERLNFRRALALLKQYSLVYIEGDDRPIRRLHVLSPIRDHMLQHRRVSDDLFLAIADAVPNLPVHTAEAYLAIGFHRGPPCRARCVELVAADVNVLISVEVASRAAQVARELGSPDLSAIYLRLGVLSWTRGDYKEARSCVLKAIEIDEPRGDWESVAEGWMICATAHVNEFMDNSEPHHLHDAQEALDKALNLCDERQIPYDYLEYCDPREIQHWANEERRKLNMPILRRSGLYTDNDSISSHSSSPTPAGLEKCDDSST
ncbi:hypothetical protein PENSPDRAFT_751811 [Peniophora sp. CONT]|nr:hypothetical protein PENSPDRAFT_751811 [Peniophora sp. CONT]